jgi:hypothetical protein
MKAGALRRRVLHLDKQSGDRAMQAPLFLLRDGARVAAILRMTLSDGLRVLSWMCERSISEYRISPSVPTLFVLLLKPPTDLPFRLAESLPS